MPDRKPRVSFVILNWNSHEVTRDCLLSLRQLAYPNFEVLLVDNGSIDSSADKLAQEFPEIRVLRNDKNLGFTGGNNVGMRDALARGADYLLLLNNDTLVAPDFLAELVQVAQRDSRIGMVNPKIYYLEPAGTLWYAGGAYVPWRTFPRHFGLRRRDDGTYDRMREVSFATGCALLVKAAMAREIGLLDDIFFLSFEDVDWSLRASAAGYKAIYVPTSVVWHRDSHDTLKNLGFATREFYNMRNTVLCARKHMPVYHLPRFAFSLTTYVAYVTLRSLLAADWKRAAALYRGVWNGCWTSIPDRDSPSASPAGSSDPVQIGDPEQKR